MLVVLPAAPAFGSQAPNTSRATRAWMMAEAHITQGSSVTYRVVPGEPVAAQRAPAGTQRLDLGMGGGIVTGDRPVRGHRQDGIALRQHRTDRHFAGGFGTARRFEREAHEIDVTAHELPVVASGPANYYGLARSLTRRRHSPTVRGSGPATVRDGIHPHRHFRLALRTWRRIFYPEDLPQHRELEFASRAFPSIEINGSFYSLQTPASYASWHARDT